MEKNFRIDIISKDENGKIKFHFNNPIVLVISLFIISMVASFFYFGIKSFTNRYYPYEGKVIAIETRFYDNLLFESNEDQHLIIETKDGEIIDRYVNQFVVLRNNIDIGDQVIKKEGFDEKVRPVGKKTFDEMMEELEKLKGE